MGTILITGGTGLVGKRLCEMLIEKSYTVAVLSRHKSDLNNIQTYLWEPDKNYIQQEAFKNADCIIHLAGANIGGGRWTKKRRKLIQDSRINTAHLLLEYVKKSTNFPKVFITASATGYYGSITSDKIFTETDKAADDFLGSTCKKWEEAADMFSELGIRTVKIRTGVVLSNTDGALPKMLNVFKRGLGAPLGNGNQYFPWIHTDDLCQIYIKAIEDNSMMGAYNAVAPEHISNKNLSEKLSILCNKKMLLPNVPAFALKMLYGRMSEILLKGSRVSSEKIQHAGYGFLYGDIDSAIRECLN